MENKINNVQVQNSNTRKRERSHCKVDILDIIKKGLELDRDPFNCGLGWIVPYKEFAINSDKFTQYYHQTGLSSAKWESIKNRMTKSKTGFIALDKIPPQGYDKIYTHVLWNGEPFTLQNNSNKNSSFVTHQVTQVTDHHVQKHEDILDNIFNSEIIPVTLLKRQPIDVWQNYQFSVSHFINEMRSLPNLFMNDFDKINFEILLSAETGTNSDVIPTSALHEFGIRFGSWIRIVEKVRNFVADGARYWFYGKCDGTTATQILLRFPNDQEYFLIRSVEVDEKSITDLKYVFAISYRKIGGPIAHQRIYRNKLDNLCMINENREKCTFFNFKEIIQTVLKNNPTPISNPQFNNLCQMPAEKIGTNDIQGKNEYEWISVKNQ